jgi:hypothetical protein
MNKNIDINYSMEDIKDCYDKIYMMRKSVMTKLGIKSDFLEEIENS